MKAGRIECSRIFLRNYARNGNRVSVSTFAVYKGHRPDKDGTFFLQSSCVDQVCAPGAVQHSQDCLGVHLSV